MNREYGIFNLLSIFIPAENGAAMYTEIKELNRMMCKECVEKAYEKCRACKVYRLVNKIAG